MPDSKSKGPAPDPFDPETIRVNSSVSIETETALTTVPVRKPKRAEFVRVHTDPAFMVDAALLEHDDGRDTVLYLVAPDMRPLVREELKTVRLFTTMTRHKVLLLWPVKLPADEGDNMRRISDSALMAAEEAKTLWTKVAWNRALGAYEHTVAKGELGDPQWPDRKFRDLLEIAFRGRVIDRPDHPVIRDLEGQL